MKYPVIVGIMLIIIAGGFLGIAVRPAGAAKMVMFEAQITTESASQENPDIWGDRIVWQDNRNGNWDIYLYNDTTMAISRITTSTANQVKPKNYGDNIVYMDNRNNGNWDIYRYNLATQMETPIANGTASQQNPAIYGNRIVWQDNRNGEWDIYMFDLGTLAETRITNSTQYPDSKYQNPAIDGNRIVWAETRITENYCCPDDQIPVTGLDRCLLETIYGRDLSSGSLYITNAVQGQAHPAISGDRVVWVGTKYVDVGLIINGQVFYEKTPIPGVFMRNVVTNSVWNTSGTTEQQNPDIFGNYIVWQGIKSRSPYDWDISIYSIDEQIENSVVNNTANQQNPANYGNSVVYQDYRNGNWDIYLTKFGYVTSLPGPGDNQTSEGGSLYVASIPSNASILINGADTGLKTNSFVRNVPAGNQNLTLIKEGYQSYSTMVNVPEGGIKVLASITLAEGSGSTSTETGTLYVASIPSNASILINGADTGLKTNSFVRNVPAGNQNLTLIKEGYQSYSTMVNVPEGGIKVLASITLTKRTGSTSTETGTLYVASIPSNASILINDADTGLKTNSFVRNVPAGNQNLTLIKEGYQSYSTMVNVPEGDMKVLGSITLSPIESTEGCTCPCSLGCLPGSCICIA